MKILDRYLILQFLQTIIFGILAFTLVFMVMDLMENLDDFVDQDVSNNIIVQYYIVFIPEMVRLVTPVAVLLASLFVAGKMSNQNELTAIKSAGVSLYRFMLPFIATALIISLLSVYFGGYIVPMANKHKVFIEIEYMKKHIIQSGTDIFFQDSQTRIVNISNYNVNTEQAYRVSIQEFDSINYTKILLRYDASRMRFDSSKNQWLMFNGTKRIFKRDKEILENFASMPIENLNFTPKEVINKQRRSEEMNLDELREFADNQLRAGNDPTRILIEYHSRFSFAFACLVTVLIGLPLSTNKRKGGLAVQFGINILITFIYLVFMQISKSFGKNGVLDPVLTAWFANGVFFITAVFNLLRIRK